MSLRVLMNRCLPLLLCALLFSPAAGQDEPLPQSDVRPLVVWWPEPLMPQDNPAPGEMLEAQTQAFVEGPGAMQVVNRRKRVSEVGGIMSTLRTASTVAPGALPDLTLLRREDLLVAQLNGLIQPLDNAFPQPLLDGLDSALALGRIEGELYGLPYMLDVLHTVYRVPPDAEGEDYTSWRFVDVLSRGQPFLFPAGRTTTTNDVFLLQYLAAGGTMPRQGSTALNAAALRTTLNFYEQALENDVVHSGLLDFTRPLDYLNLYLDAYADAGIFSSTTYLTLREQDPTLMAAPIPTATGQTITALNGWMWVLVTTDPVRQSMALRYLSWMMDVERQVQYATVAHRLPSQRAGLPRLLVDGDYAQLVNSMLTNVVIPFSESEGGAVLRALQDALAAVLRGERTAEEAVEAAVQQLSE